MFERLIFFCGFGRQFGQQVQALEVGRFQVDGVRAEIARSPRQVADALELALARVQFAILSQFKSRLQRESSRLSGEGCWGFLHANLVVARRFGVEDELRHLVYVAAGRFADIRMLRQTARYGTRIAPLPDGLLAEGDFVD